MEIRYFEECGKVLDKINETQGENINSAATLMADAIGKGNLVHLFGSGHSVIPILDVFPRYGGFVGFHPLMDNRLMWHNVIGVGGARELLWIERQEGYISNFLQSYTFKPGDVMVVYSHGGLNAAPVEVAMYAKERGLKVVVVTSGENYKKASPAHSSGNKLGDIADVLIDNCCPLEDAVVSVPGYYQPVGASSTVAVVYITQAFASQTALILEKRGVPLKIFVSPNVVEVPQTNNDEVYEEYTNYIKKNSVDI